MASPAGPGSSLLAQLRSSNPTLQLSGLASLALAERLSLEQSQLSAVIDCLGAEHADVRAEAYRLLETLPQAFSSQHIADITSAALNELSNADSAQALEAAMSFLYALPNGTLLGTCATTEGMQALRIPENLSEDDALNAAAHRSVGRVLVRVWLLLDDGLESWVSVESQAEAGRRKEAMQDFILDFILRVAQRISSQTPRCNEYCSVLSFILDLHRYYDDSFDLQHCISSILGLINESKESHCQRMLCKIKASRLAFLLQRILPVMFAYPLILPHHYKQHHSDDARMRSFISGVFLIFWKSTPIGNQFNNVSYTLITKSKDTSIFAADGSDEVLKVSLAPSSHDLLALSLDWIEHYLFPSLQKSSSRQESYEIVVMILSFLFYPQFQDYRTQFIWSLVERLFQILHARDMKYDSLYDSLLVCILFCARHGRLV